MTEERSSSRASVLTCKTHSLRRLSARLGRYESAFCCGIVAKSGTRFELHLQQAYTYRLDNSTCFEQKLTNSYVQGSGFVQYALPEDAVRAIKEYSGKLLLGRAVQVCHDLGKRKNNYVPLSEYVISISFISEGINYSLGITGDPCNKAGSSG